MPHDRTAHSAVALAFDAERLTEALAATIPDARTRKAAVAAILEEGPVHHRGASYALILLAAMVAGRGAGAAGGKAARDAGKSAKDAGKAGKDHGKHDHLPIHLDAAALDVVAGGDAGIRQVIADALTDGPEHHAMANVALFNVLAAQLGGGGR